ncbi:MAG: hypothetical protein AABM41_03895 [Chloroflexota bacterium]
MRFAWLVVVTGLVTACAAVPSASPSAAEPSATTAAVSGLPPGCETIDLRSPTGERIDLNGEWTGSATLFNASEVALLNEVGGCVYGSVTGVDPDGSEVISNLSGRLSSDFTIEFEVVIVYQHTVFPFGEYSTMVMFIEWDDDGRIRLREDRETGEAPGRCIDGRFECPPVIWYRVDDVPPQ